MFLNLNNEFHCQFLYMWDFIYCNFFHYLLMKTDTLKIKY
jgi:hypothetical protein